jgi:hypothetical protein
MPDLHETIGKYMKKKAANKLENIQVHQLEPVMIARVPVADGYPIPFKLYDTIIGNGYSVSVTTQIINHPFPT